jgi:uridine kinase
MIGDIVFPEPHHTTAAEAIFELVKDKVGEKRVALTIAGESGAGKSEIALEIERLFAGAGKRSLILQQDDYFFLPPKSNEENRRKHIKSVGLGEVNLVLMNEHIRRFKFSPGDKIEKPLIVFEENRVDKETVAPADYGVLIAEGTYTTLLKHADYHVFIDITYEETLAHRKGRGRDPLDEVAERFLEIEHSIISKHKTLAEIIVNRDYTVTWVDK